MDDAELAEWIRELKDRGGFLEVYRETTFKALREGDEEEYRITVQDAGPDTPRSRYSVTVRAMKSGREASGNPGDSLYRVLTGLHWRNLEAGE